MIERMLCFGLVVIPFYEVITFFLLPAQSIAFFDTRFPKECVALMIAMAIGCYGIYHGGIKPLKNIFLIVLLMFLSAIINKVPAAVIHLGTFDISNFWVWKPFLQIMVYFLMLLVVASVPWQCESIQRIFKVMMFCGLGMAIYILFQKAGLDQIFYQKPHNVIMDVPNASLVGTMGLPSLVAPLIALCLIPAFYFKQYIFAMAMIIAVLFIGSAFSILGMLVGLVLFLGAEHKQIAVALLIALFLLLSFMVFASKANGKLCNFLSDSGRFAVWTEVLKDMVSPLSDKDPRKASLTGFGLGSYSYLFPVKHQSDWVEAHNEYLEMFYCSGVIGICLLIGFLLSAIAPIWSLIDINALASCLFAMMAVIGIIAFGVPVWHLAVYQFYTVVILGMIYQLRNSYGTSID